MVFDDLLLLFLSFLDEVKHLAPEEHLTQDLEVSLGVDVQEVQHYVDLGDAVDDLVHVAFPPAYGDVALWEFLTCEEQSDAPEHFVAKVNLGLFGFNPLNRVTRKISYAPQVFYLPRVLLFGLPVEVEHHENHLHCRSILLTVEERGE